MRPAEASVSRWAPHHLHADDAPAAQRAHRHAVPAASPPPPTGTTTMSTSGMSSAISSPTVPCPATISGSSNAGMMTSARSLAMRSAWTRAAS
jgi:hypothetical protein